MDDSDAGLTRVVERLKKLKAVKLRVHCTDGEQRPVPIPQGRKRWLALKQILNGLEWVKIEACDARGGVLDVFESGLEIDAFEEEFDTDDARSAKLLQTQGQLLNLMLKAQDVALQRQGEYVKDVLDSAVKLNRVLSERLMATEKLYDAKIRAMEALRDSLEEGSDGDGLMSGKMMEAVAPLVAAKLAKSVSGGAGE